MLSPNTAQPGRSVWDQVGRETFESGLDSLHRTKYVPEPQTLSQQDWPKPRRNEVLPFAIEKQLSDDIAFISAYDYGVGYVTAATIEAGERDGLLVRLAANEGVGAVVTDAWTSLFFTLEKCAKKALCREQCAEDALDVVLNLNRNKILGRLASRHFRRPQHERGPARKALSERLTAYFRASKQQSAETNELSRQIEALHAAFLDVEKSGPDTGTLRRVVKEAFRLTVDGVSLPDRLRRASFSPSNLDTRVIREISKIANYWRICHSLAHLSRSYRALFSKIKLESLKPFGPSVCHGNSKTRYIHAEVQIVVYYEIRGPPVWPRAIGASKEACFLCNSFIKAHGLFYISKAHCQIYPQWTIPDLANYTAETLSRLRITLIAVNRDVASAHQQARRERSVRALPLQSSVNLHRLCLPTPSVTTIRSSSLVETDTASETAGRSPQRLPPPTPETELLENSQLSPSRTLSSLSAGSAPISNPAISSTTTGSKEASKSNDDVSVRVDIKIPESPFSGWLDLYVSLERNSVEHPSAQSFMTASINQRYIPDSIAVNERECHRLDLNTLALGEEVVLDNPTDPDEDDNGDTEMSVILTYQRMNPIMLKCSWHGRANLRV